MISANVYQQRVKPNKISETQLFSALQLVFRDVLIAHTAAEAQCLHGLLLDAAKWCVRLDVQTSPSISMLTTAQVQHWTGMNMLL